MGEGAKTSALAKGVDRRRFLEASVGTAASPVIAQLTGSTSARAQTRRPPSDRVPVSMSVNGVVHDITVDVRATLLDTLRRQVSLTGTKKGCDHGQCGACTVLIDGKRVLSCLTLAAMVRGEVTTIEGIGDADGELHPMQQAFIDHDAFQCGYCTPGQIMSAIGCVKEGHAATAQDIREYMSGNLCRCAAYPNIVAAIEDAAEKMRG